jgi:putative colanic acid biosynthesis acetyltransferase WcaF
MNTSNQYQQLDQFSLPPHFRGRSAFVVQLWWILQGTLFGLSPQFMYGWRVFLLRLFGAQIGKHVLIRPSVRVTYPWKVFIGDFSWIGDQVVLYSLGEIHVGSHTVISQRSYLCPASHDYASRTFDMLVNPITIGSGVWIASDVFIGPGVNVGEGCVVGARSTVLHDLPEGKVCYGNPAHPVKDRPIPVY